MKKNFFVKCSIFTSYLPGTCAVYFQRYTVGFLLCFTMKTDFIVLIFLCTYNMF